MEREFRGCRKGERRVGVGRSAAAGSIVLLMQSFAGHCMVGVIVCRGDYILLLMLSTSGGRV